MSIISTLSGPIIGAVIGYGTNYIAVKMLFRPLNPIKIGKYTLPFTPGIFPKRKNQLAKALGNTVGNNLLTSEDVEKMFLSEDMMKSIVDGICDSIYATDDNHTIKNMLSGYFKMDNYDAAKKQLEDMICEKIVAGFLKLDIGTVVATEGARAIKEKAQGTMIAMFLNDEVIKTLAGPIGEQVEVYVNNNGSDMVMKIVKEEIAYAENQTIGNLADKIGIDEERIRGIVREIYTEFIHKKIGKFIKKFDIANIVEQKVNDMNVLEIENLVLSVMKNELNAIINLGVVIGFIIGLLNLLV